MTRYMDRRCRIINYLKVLLTLSGLCLLLTPFLAVYRQAADAELPFSEMELEDRIRSQQATAPLHSLVSNRGDVIQVKAVQAIPGDNGTPAAARHLTSEINLVGGGRITIASERGALYPSADTVVFTENVVVTSADGLVAETQELSAQLSGISAQSPGTVYAFGPFGELTAGNMRIGVKTEGGPLHMFFKKGVRLRYIPQELEKIGDRTGLPTPPRANFAALGP